MTTSTRREIRISEHGRRVEAELPPPTPAELRQAESLRNAARIDVKWLAGDQVEVTGFQWVGMARFEAFDVIIEPRLVGGEARVLQMLDYAAGLEMASFVPDPRPLPPKGPDLLDLICLLLANESQELLRAGVLSDYRHASESLPLMRGRLRFRDQMLKRFGQLDRLECEFDEYDSDIIENQLVRSGLVAARRLARDPEIRQRVQRMSIPWEQACPSPGSAHDLRTERIVYGRRNNRYRRAHLLSRLLLDGMGLDDMLELGDGSVSAFFINMANLFERFLTRLLGDQLADHGIAVGAQRSLRAIITSDATGASYKPIRPDLIAFDDSKAHVITIEAKYKGYDLRKLDSSDLYQSFTYAYSLSRPTDRKRGMVIFPSTRSQVENISVAAIGSAPSVGLSLVGINIAQVLSELEQGDALATRRLTQHVIWNLDRSLTPELC